jgi:D-alanine-D-alanine ligase
MKVLILFDLPYQLDPDETLSPKRLKEEQRPTEADVMKSLVRLGHAVETLPVFDNVSHILEKLHACAPDVVFNLSESFHDNRAHEPNIPALLELMKVRYTGAGPDALMLCKDKAITKKVLAYHHVRVPGFVVSHRQSPLRRLKRFKFPAFVKPRAEESSDGISKASFARDEGEAIERAQFIHQKFDCDALIEEYIEGRELYVSVLGNRRPTVFPPREVFFDKMPADAPKFATYRAKWNDAYRKKWGITNGAAQELPPKVEKDLRKIARNVYGWLKIRGCGRLDVRLTPNGELFVIEANPNPSLSQDEDFALSAAASGMDYDALITAILSQAMS